MTSALTLWCRYNCRAVARDNVLKLLFRESSKNAGPSLLAPLIQKFKDEYGNPPEFCVRCPGRVNLIGEHIDGYGVLPMTIEQSIRVVCRLNKESGQLRLRNDNPKFAPYEADANKLEIDRSKPEWYHYFLCGYRGMLEELGLKPTGMDVLLRGGIPPSAGLSSSSAIVCSAAITTLLAQTGQGFEKLSRDKIAELCASCERYIGTQGGGMDQAICMLANAGMAKKIDFNPLRTDDVKLPTDVAFVVCHCCAQMNKAASSCFNERVVECRLAAQLLAQSQGLDWRKIDRNGLGQLQQELGKSLEQMKALAENALKSDPYSKAQLCEALKCSEVELMGSMSENTKHMTSFRLRDRALHVYGEAGRVGEFVKVCSESVPNAEKLGQLMNESHSSCSKLYDCSCAQLDELVRVCRSAGALGSRLTGAGWGGCTVSMVPCDRVDKFLEKVKADFYESSDARKAKFDELVFVTQPYGGAKITPLGKD